MSDENSEQKERRVYHEVRAIFVEACMLLAPLVQNSDKTVRMSGFAMAHVIKNKFPDLSNADVSIIIATVERLQRENRLQSLVSQEQP